MWVGVASLVVQTHVAYVYVVGLAGGGGRRSPLACRLCASAATAWCSFADRVVATRTFLWTSSWPSLAWTQPIGEQLFGRGEGNLQRLATHAGEGDLTVGAGRRSRSWPR